MTYRLIFLNLSLAVLISIGGINMRNLAKAYAATHQPSFVHAMPETLPTIADRGPSQPSVEDWTDIPTKNLFSFDRSDVTLAAPPPPPPQNTGPKPVLAGTLALGKELVAMVAPGQAGPRSFQPMHVGETVDGWTILEIKDKSMIVSANNIQQTIILNDPMAQIPRATDRTAGVSAVPMAPPPATTVGSTPASTTPPKTKVIQTPFGPKTVPVDPPNDE